MSTQPRASVCAVILSVFMIAARGHADTQLSARSRLPTREQFLTQNAAFSLWDVEWTDKPATEPQHSHERPAVAVMRDGGVLLDEEGKEHLRLPGEVVYFPAGSIIATGHTKGDLALHALVIEPTKPVQPSKRPRSDAPNAFPRDNATQVLDNTYFVAWEYTFQPDVPLPLHFHDKPYVTVWLSPGRIKRVMWNGAEGDSTVQVNAWYMATGGQIDSERALDVAVRSVTVEIK